MDKVKKKGTPSEKGKKRWIVIASFIVLSGLGFVIVFNIAGMGIRANNILASFPITQGVFEKIEEPKTPLELEKEKLNNEKKALEAQRINLDELANNLMLWEQQLKDKEEELSEQRAIVEDLQQRLDVKVKNVQELVTYCDKMDASDAVKILDNISDNRLILNILRNMKEQKCSEILAAMDPKKAARLIEAMSAE